MKRIFLFMVTAMGMQFIANVGCAKAETLKNWSDDHQGRLANNSDQPNRHLPPKELTDLQFGFIQIGGVHCDTQAGETARLERDALHLPDFLSLASMSTNQELKRSTCNLSIPYQTLSRMGFVITGVELTHERLLSKGTRLRLSGEAFIAGNRGVNFEEAILARRSDHEEIFEQRLYEFEQPLVVCGKSEGILRLNLSQVLDREYEGGPSSSRLFNLRLLYAPIDCHE